MELSLQDVLVFAPDLEAARHFYGEVLGLNLVGNGENYISFEGANFQLEVFSCETPTQPTRRRWMRLPLPSHEQQGHAWRAGGGRLGRLV